MVKKQTKQKNKPKQNPKKQNKTKQKTTKTHIISMFRREGEVGGWPELSFLVTNGGTFGCFLP